MSRVALRRRSALKPDSNALLNLARTPSSVPLGEALGESQPQPGETEDGAVGVGGDGSGIGGGATTVGGTRGGRRCSASEELALHQLAGTAHHTLTTHQEALLVAACDESPTLSNNERLSQMADAPGLQVAVAPHSRATPSAMPYIIHPTVTPNRPAHAVPR